jgi:hypothetical protein
VRAFRTEAMPSTGSSQTQTLDLASRSGKAWSKGDRTLAHAQVFRHSCATMGYLMQPTTSSLQIYSTS